ncbi:putative transposase [Vogesella perlucida]|nr:putative transposase [Vogesella perlucida]
MRNVGWAKRSVPTVMAGVKLMADYRRFRQAGGYYFFTLTLADRGSCLLVDEISRLRQAYRTVAIRRPFETLAICVLPDHLHAVWRLPEGDSDFSTRWAQIKALFSRGLAARERSDSKVRHREKGIWQRRFWEHCIRDADDLQRHIDYVHINPVKHGLVARVMEWPHSSFHRYVQHGELPADWATSGLLLPQDFGE